MSDKSVRVLVVAPLGIGGISTLMINIQKNINRQKINFDYLTLHDRKEPLEDTALQMGSHKYVASADSVPFKPLRFFVRLFQITKICRDNNIKILHYNDGTPKGIMNVLAAKAGGVKYVTYHSHNGGTTDTSKAAKIVNDICRPIIPLVCDDLWACSGLAAEFTFPAYITKQKKYYFMPNGIDLEKFKYNESIRKEVRTELGLENNFVVGHAGRFNCQKNHLFLIDIFAQIYAKNHNSVLLLFGVGETQEKVKAKVHLLGLDEHVKFMGASGCIERMYQAMDVFLMPSLFEGLPVTGVEAQAAGLPIVFSDVITRELVVSPYVSFVPLRYSAEQWADKVLQYSNIERHDYCDLLRSAGFEQAEMVAHFEHYYLDAAEKIGLL